jgi:hypothetical protein
MPQAFRPECKSGLFQPTRLWEGDCNPVEQANNAVDDPLSTHPSLGRQLQHSACMSQPECLKAFQPTHLWEGNCNTTTTIDGCLVGYFQPTHLWEGNCNSRSQNRFHESFSSLVLAKLRKLSLVYPSERLL